MGRVQIVSIAVGIREPAAVHIASSIEMIPKLLSVPVTLIPSIGRIMSIAELISPAYAILLPSAACLCSTIPSICIINAYRAAIGTAA